MDLNVAEEAFRALIPRMRRRRAFVAIPPVGSPPKAVTVWANSGRVRRIANGKSTDSVITSLHQEEARKKVVIQELSRLDSLAQVVALDAKRLAKNLRSRLGDIPALFSRHISLARQMLRKLLDGHILCEPIMEGGRAGYRFTATGTFDRLLTGFKFVNESGGGQGS
jgi:hypothetical protein